MNKLKLILLVFFVIIFYSCEDDNQITGEVLEPDQPEYTDIDLKFIRNNKINKIITIQGKSIIFDLGKNQFIYTLKINTKSINYLYFRKMPKT